jgi:hypothetical protein
MVHAGMNHPFLITGGAGPGACAGVRSEGMVEEGGKGRSVNRFRAAGGGCDFPHESRQVLVVDVRHGHIPLLVQQAPAACFFAARLRFQTC